ncbi:hypothetical protein AB0O80_10685 [Rothia kristinae]|uniref:hypothetical protein n=1 Tax=Actinomycetes TaxID=1760 RepID=UPI003430D814
MRDIREIIPQDGTGIAHIQVHEHIGETIVAGAVVIAHGDRVLHLSNLAGDDLVIQRYRSCQSHRHPGEPLIPDGPTWFQDERSHTTEESLQATVQEFLGRPG